MPLASGLAAAFLGFTLWYWSNWLERILVAAISGVATGFYIHHTLGRSQGYLLLAVAVWSCGSTLYVSLRPPNIKASANDPAVQLLKRLRSSSFFKRLWYGW